MQNNEVLTAIKNRRSIRKYKQTAVPEELLQQIVEAGRQCASANNMQPWFFSVCTNAEINDRVVGLFRLAIERSGQTYARFAADREYHNFYHAPAVIYIAGKTDSAFKWIDPSAATQFMALAAHSLGIGSVIVGSVKPAFLLPESKEVMSELRIPDGYEMILSLALGYADEAPESKERIDGNFAFIRS